jgi:hypothetical protein
MAAGPDERCGTRTRRRPPEAEGCDVPAGQETGLTPLGQALLDLLRDDPRYRDIIADPWGDHPAER